MAKRAQRTALRSVAGVLTLSLAIGLLAAGYRLVAERTQQAAPAIHTEQVMQAELLAGVEPIAPVERAERTERAAVAPRVEQKPAAAPLAEAGAVGTLSGQLVPADGGAVVHFYGRDGSASRYTFADPNSGNFTVPELPVDVYRVVVRPENPELEPRVIEDVVVPWGREEDMGAIDLRPAGEQASAEQASAEQASAEQSSAEDAAGAAATVGD
jgi:hypothetical protein